MALYKAASDGRADEVAALLQRPDLGELQSLYGFDHVLYAAIRHSHVEVVHALFTDPRVDPGDPRVNFKFHTAVSYGNVEIVRAFLTHPRFTLRDSDGAMLGRAASLGHMEVARLLLRDKRVEVAADDVLMAAGRGGNVELVRMLVEHVRLLPTWVKRCVAVQRSYALVLRGAIQNDKVGMARFVLASAPRPCGFARTNGLHSWNPELCAAVRKGNVKMVRLLLTANHSRVDMLPEARDFLVRHTRPRMNVLQTMAAARGGVGTSLAFLRVPPTKKTRRSISQEPEDVRAATVASMLQHRRVGRFRGGPLHAFALELVEPLGRSVLLWL